MQRIHHTTAGRGSWDTLNCFVFRVFSLFRSFRDPIPPHLDLITKPIQLLCLLNCELLLCRQRTIAGCVFLIKENQKAVLVRLLFALRADTICCPQREWWIQFNQRWTHLFSERTQLDEQNFWPLPSTLNSEHVCVSLAYQPPAVQHPIHNTVNQWVTSFYSSLNTCAIVSCRLRIRRWKWCCSPFRVFISFASSSIWIPRMNVCAAVS